MVDNLKKLYEHEIVFISEVNEESKKSSFDTSILKSIRFVLCKTQCTTATTSSLKTLP
jgi:hypothetical protein